MYVFHSVSMLLISYIGPVYISNFVTSYPSEAIEVAVPKCCVFQYNIKKTKYLKQSILLVELYVLQNLMQDCEQSDYIRF
jgi:hypothetical protein